MPFRRTTVKGLQPGFISVLSEIALQALNAKIEASRDPLRVYDYAEALDAFIAILPPEIKYEIRERLGVDVDVVVSEALASCERDPYTHPYSNAVQCAKLVKDDLDKLLRVVFDIAHRKGLFVIEKEVMHSAEA